MIVEGASIIVGSPLDPPPPPTQLVVERCLSSCRESLGTHQMIIEDTSVIM